jgi:aminoglycoside phosphotransferase (APT) family kinase protein
MRRSSDRSSTSWSAGHRRSARGAARHQRSSQVRHAVSAALVDALADLHAVDLAVRGLLHLGKPGASWNGRSAGGPSGGSDEGEQIATWIAWRGGSWPRSRQIEASHSRAAFKLDNLMLDATYPERIVAVFDWEMSALGDPLVDLGILLAYWVSIAPAGGDALTTVTSRPGWFTRDELIDRYQARSGRDLSTLHYFEVFALFKIAVVIQQIYFRFVKGQTDDPRFANFCDRVAYLARHAVKIADT